MIEQNKYIAVLEVANKRFEENEKLREKVDIWHRAAQKNYDDKEDLKERIDKAIEYIHEHQPVFELSSKEQIQEWFEKEYYIELLDILKGESDEEVK